MSKEEFKIPNEEFKDHLLHLLSEDSEFLDEVRRLLLIGKEPTMEEEANKKEVINIDIKENNELYSLRRKIEGNNKIITQLELEKQQLEEEMKYFENLKELYKNLKEQFKKTDKDKSELESKTQILKEKMNRYTEKNNELQESNKNLKNTEDSYKSELTKNENENKELKKKVMGYEDQFANMIKVHKKYLNLSSRAKESLSGIFKDESLMGFVACGIQESNIESLWDYIKDEIKEEKYEGVNELKEIFGYLFSLYQLSNPKYEWQKVEIGTNFDTEDHIRHSSGKVSGEIAEVMLKGYENKNNGRIIRKSLVKVG